jgi:argininosuccinate lyase
MGGLRNLIGRILLGLAFAALLAGGPAVAKETVLTEDGVSHFLASFGEMRDIAIMEGLKTGTDSELAKNPLGAVLKAIKSSKLKTDAEKIAKAHGFADLKDWGTTGKAVAQAYLFITAGPARGIARDTLEQNKKAAISQLEKLGIVNANNKQKLTEKLDKLEDDLSREPPPENVAIVKKMKPDIDAAVKIGAD